MRTPAMAALVGEWGSQYSNQIYQFTKRCGKIELKVFDITGEDPSGQVLEQSWNSKNSQFSCAIYFSSTGRLIWARLELINRDRMNFDFTYTQIATIWPALPIPSKKIPSLAGYWKCGQSSLWYNIAKHQGGFKLLAAIDPIDQERAVITQSKWMKRKRVLRFDAFLKSNGRTFTGEITFGGDNDTQLIYNSTCFESMFRIDPASLKAAKRCKSGEFLLEPARTDLQ